MTIAEAPPRQAAMNGSRQMGSRQMGSRQMGSRQTGLGYQGETA
jgi:hypothetical protein